MTSFLDGQATRAALTSFLTKEIPPKLAPDNPFLVYFAGHGVAEGDGSQGPQGYLIPQDAELGKPDTWLSMDTFRAALDALACRHLLVVLDCCYAGAFRWATATRDISLVGAQPLYESVYQRYLDGEAWQALTSASAAQRAADSGMGLPNLRGIDANGHSPFAAALLAGLAGAADSSIGSFPPDGVITATELYQYVSTCLLPAPDTPTTQTPGIWPLRPDSVGEFVFLNPKVPLEVAADPKLDETTNPWLGLEAYTAESKDLYFGRQDETAALVARVRKRRSTGALIAVVGASGAGKTSLVQAGLVPALTASKSSSWEVVQAARLADDPNAVLADAVAELEKAPKRHRRLLFFDQFDELYTLCSDEERDRFLASLRELISGKGGPVVVVTIRSDFELRAADDKALKDLWQGARFQVPPLSGDELRQVILGPAQVKAVFFDPAKVADDIYDEVSQTPGALPLLSFALAELYRTAWERREKTDRALTEADYKKLGGVVGALNRKATQLYDSAAPDEQQAIRRVFLRLVSQEGAGLTGRRVEMAELQFGNGDDAEQKTVQAAIDLYVAAGLLVLDGDTVEPAHDALIAQWQELHDWLKSSESQDLIRAAWTAASRWAGEHEKRKAQGYLWDRDPRLPQLRAAHLAGDLNATERAFETASTKLRTARRRRVVGTTAAVMAALAIAALIAWVQRNHAITNQKSATSEALTAIARAQPAGSLDASLLLTLAGYETSPTVAAKSELISLLQDVPGTVLHGGRRPVESLAFAPHAQELAVGDAGGTVRLWNTATRRELGVPLATHQHTIWQLAFSPSGRILATAGADGRLRLWHVGAAVMQGPTLGGPSQAVDSVAFNETGTMIAAGYDNGVVKVWHLRGATPLQAKDLPARIGASPNQAVVGLAFSPDGTTIAAARRDGEVQLWRGGKPTVSLRACTCTLHGLAFSPGGKTLAAAGNGVFLWNLTGVSRSLSPRVLAGAGGAVWDVAFSSDGHRLAAALGDGRAMVWQVKSDTPSGPAESLKGHAGAVLAVAFAPGGGTLASAGAGGAVLLWNVHHPLVVRSLGERSQEVNGLGFTPGCCSGAGSSLFVAGNAPDNTSRAGYTVGRWTMPEDMPQPSAARSRRSADAVAVSPNGRLLAVADGRILVYEIQGGRISPLGSLLSAGTEVDTVSFSPDGSSLAAGGAKAWVWDVQTGSGQPVFRPGGPLPGSAGSAMSIAFSHDGKTLAAGYDDGTVRIWKVAGGKRPTVISHPGASNVHVAFSPDGRWLAACYDDGTVRLFKAAAPKAPGRRLSVESDGTPVNAVAFSPDSRTLATADDDGTVRLWDVATLSEFGPGLTTPEGSVLTVAFSPDGKTLAAGGYAGIDVWQGLFWHDRAGLIARVCGLVAGPVTKADWNSLAPGLPYRAPCPSQTG